MSKIEIVALSGGKDSTAMALRLAELEPDVPRRYLCTPTGNELPEMVEHWKNLEALLGQPMVQLTNHTLEFWIDEFGALPNHRQRWCTRLLKIEPCVKYLKDLRVEGYESVICVGLRSDEPSREGVIYDDATERYPLREWGWGIGDVLGYLRQRRVTVPRRTDCAWCYDQQILELWLLDKEHPDLYEAGLQKEQQTGYTFRTPKKNPGKWPAGLLPLREKFHAGHKPQGSKRQLKMFPEYQGKKCRVCTL